LSIRPSNAKAAAFPIASASEPSASASEINKNLSCLDVFYHDKAAYKTFRIITGIFQIFLQYTTIVIKQKVNKFFKITFRK